MNFEPIPRLLGNLVAPLLFFRDRYLGTLAAWPHPNQPVRSMFRAQYSSNEAEDGFQTYVQPPWWEESEGFESSFHCVWSQRSSNIFLDRHRLLPAPFCLVASTKTPMPSLISRSKVQKCPFPVQDSAAPLTSPTNVARVFFKSAWKITGRKSCWVRNWVSVNPAFFIMKVYCKKKPRMPANW